MFLHIAKAKYFSDYKINTDFNFFFRRNLKKKGFET